MNIISALYEYKYYNIEFLITIIIVILLYIIYYSIIILLIEIEIPNKMNIKFDSGNICII